MTEWGFTLENVTASWGKGQNTIENLNFTFSISNSTTAMLPLMGPSGQGKSTLLYLLAALKWPIAGKITWRFPDGTTQTISEGGSHLSNKQAVQLRRERFGFDFQDSTLSEHLTIIENIAYPLLYQGKTWKEALSIATERFHQVLLDSERANQKTLMDSFPAQLSGGQRQRAALAQAIIHNPTVLFADEPTGQLDIQTRKQVMDFLKNWVEEGDGQRCFIWVTHHHVDDLKLMGVNELLFIENKTGERQDRKWLEKWVIL